ncbi:Signal transduction histidine kinase [Desulfomicrobium apsheronum]|uniref:histidine kinase n=1 Tax=Desulfomicrobium apsheronum TaxID=52560 RepID=A0A1I3Y766_9BACT|nr:ATP-binding protein [Desulfomicrobium apsheronum]SFK27827.1 Signal transduction histidine kinase [Desulfomicrobium apsheronum]
MATFKTRARALDMLGRQQIAGIPTAISELFKNAHDAYANRAEVDFYRSDGLFVLRDDGVGMTEEEFLDRWLTLGTESKLKGRNATPPPKMAGKDERILLGEKGVGRLAIAIIGPQVLVLSRAIREEALCETVAAFIHWGLFECPGADLDKIEFAVRTFPAGTLPTSKDINDMVDVCRSTLNGLKELFDADAFEKISNDLDSFVLDPYEIDGYVSDMSLQKEGHGTHFIIKPTSEMLCPDIDEGKAVDSAPPLYKMLRGFSNTMTPGHTPPVLQTAFRDHKSEEAFDDLIAVGKFFTPKEFINADHQICGEFDEYGQFNGSVTIFGKEFPNHIISWRGGHGSQARCGPFKISVANVQGAERESTLPLEDWGELIQKMNRFGGLYIYRDGVRMLPYGGNDSDWLDLEKNRSKSALYYHFSYRRIFGVVELSSTANPNLREKAGREGFRENGAYRDLQNILKNFFVQLAADFFRRDAAEDFFQVKKAELNDQDAARRKREMQVSQKRTVFKEQIDTFFHKVDVGDPQLFVGQLIDDIHADLRVAALINNPAEAAEAFMKAEADARAKLSTFENEYRIVKPRIGLGKAVLDDWAKYQTAFENLQIKVFSQARELIEGEVQERAAEAKIALDKRIRIERSLDELSKDAQKVGRTERRATEEQASQVNTDVLNAAKSSVKNINAVMQSVFAEFARLDVSSMDDDSIIKERDRLEKALIDVRDKERAYLQRLQNQLESIDTSEGSTQIEQMEALEQRAIALEEQVATDLQLTQLGMAIEVINHEFDSSIRSIRDYIRRLKGWADINEGLEGIYQGIRSSFDHLDGYLTLFTPLHRRLYRKEVKISGSEINKFLIDLFGERFKRHEVELLATPSFKRAEFMGYPSSFYPVFVNVVDNAIFWIKDQPTRVITLDAIGSTLVIKDTGPGVPERDHDSIFELGFSRKPGGRGMGLHISREVLSRVDYDLSLRHTHSGAEFHISPKVFDA